MSDLTRDAAEYDIRITVKRVLTNEARTWQPDAVEVADELNKLVRDREVAGWWFAGAVPL